LVLKNLYDKFAWILVVVYGSPYDEFKQDFIKELHMVMAEWQGPTMVGGDFNLVRYQYEKSNGIINFNHDTMFNDWINCWGLIEIKDPCRYFSWSNNQESPIMATLDRILVSTNWEVKYPLVRVNMLPRG
jgi:hypothetical protein